MRVLTHTSRPTPHAAIRQVVRPFLADGKRFYNIAITGQDTLHQCAPLLGDGVIAADDAAGVRKFLLTKAINAEHSWYGGSWWIQRSLRVRHSLLEVFLTWNLF